LLKNKLRHFRFFGYSPHPAKIPQVAGEAAFPGMAPVKFDDKVKEMKKKAANRAAKKPAATAASIPGPAALGAKRWQAKIKPQWQKYYNHLLELRERLLHQMSGLAKESAEEMANYSLHMADSGTDNFDRDFALSLLSSDQDAIYEIEEALKRIEKRPTASAN
jgi:DnaK suppressor protein